MCPGLLGVDLLRAHNRHIERGNTEFKGGKPAEALKLYDKALHQDGLADPQARAATEFNRGAAFSALGKTDEAGQAYLEATKSKDNSLRARAFYNLGNTFFKGEKWSESLEAYKRSLMLDPHNRDAKWNLELALRRKKDQDEKDKDKKKDDDKNKDKGDNKDKDKKDDKKDSDKKDGDKKDGDKKDPDNPDNKGKDDKGKDDKGQDEKQNDGKNEPPPQDPTKPDEKDGAKPNEAPQPAPGDEQKGNAADMKEINAVLDSLEQSPRQIEQQRARARAQQRRAPVKDW